MQRSHRRTNLSRRELLGAGALLPFILSDPANAATSWGTRKPSTNSTRSIHSGHSLTDAYITPGDWPGDLRKIVESLGIAPAENLVKSTIPGSPLSWRWQHAVPNMQPADPIADARLDIAGFDTLMITASGPPARIGVDDSAMAETLDFLCRFVSNAISNGNHGKGADDIIVWSIWPSLTMWQPDCPESWREFPNFRAALPEYGRSFHFMASYAAWKMRQVHPNLDASWKVWLFPGHLWMAQVYDDIGRRTVPDIRMIEDLFSDDIHPDEVGGYGLACFVITCLYQVDLRKKSDMYRSPVVSESLREYFAETAWNIARDYGPVGMGGKTDKTPSWDESSMTDPLPGWALENI